MEHIRWAGLNDARGSMGMLKSKSGGGQVSLAVHIQRGCDWFDTFVAAEARGRGRRGEGCERLRGTLRTATWSYIDLFIDREPGETKQC